METSLETETLKTILTCTNAAPSKEMTLYLDENGMSSREVFVIAEFLSSNPTLTQLDLSGSCFDDVAAAALANALSSNTNLGVLDMRETLSLNGSDKIVENGRFALLRAIFDVSSLKSCASSNHTCQVCGIEQDASWKNRYQLQDISALNGHKLISTNKWEKIFAMLALSGGDLFLNTTLLESIPAQLIPMLLNKADYAADEDDDSRVTDLYLELTDEERCNKHDVWDNLGNTKSLNCMYGLMKSWVVPLIFV
ncbi:hypothetical protein THAOC_04691 [Thalassiosira oceanica]|uniref:Uncharacterized protein n=1 Tax=Thalassiosira oceanica TaxID=159749 RepID=K0TIR9_THAOC|nr:hypothetical protein THAOC_04691 [Thalassiosira oceanica]|eukprot:EJK73676.1 hypothetical protein THAOC_04691 [Thalassiosira oceanica]